MSESTLHERVRDTIADARRTIQRDTLLDASFKAKAVEGLDLIVADLNAGRITAEKANSLGGSLMQAVLIQRQHNEFQAKSRQKRELEMGAAATFMGL